MNSTGCLECDARARVRGSEVVRLLLGSAVLSAGLIAAAPICIAADAWDGSLGATSDYLMRGISRSNGRAALQLDLHYMSNSGIIAGLFASNTQIDPSEPTDVEVSGFLGFAWNAGNDWHGKALASHYAYPWNRAGKRYDYDELDVDLAYQEWLDITFAYSPDAPRFLSYRGLFGAVSESAEVNVQRPVFGKLSATAGIGYSHLGGPDATGYVYGSVGAAYDLAPFSLAVSYVNTSAGAKALFYNAAASNRWTGTIIWRF